MRTELRHALRFFRASPTFALVAIVTLGLAIGGTTSIYGFVRGILLKPLPYPEADRLIAISRSNPAQGFKGLYVVGYELAALSERTRSFDVLTGATYDQINLSGLSGDASPERVTAARALPELLPLLGIEPSLGRGFHEGEREGSVILSYGLWTRRFGGTRDALGKTLRFDGESATIVGVLPQGARLPLRDADVVMPLDPLRLRDDPPTTFLSLFGRLAAGAGIAAAREEATRVARQLEEEKAYPVKGWGLDVDDLRTRLVGDTETALWILQAAVALALLVACANFASLLLAKGILRERELALRRALGASRARLTTLLLTESLSLALLGGILGLALAWGATRLIFGILPSDVPRVEEVSVDLAVVGFAFGISAMAGVLSGLLPAALLSRRGLEPALRGSVATTATAGAGRARSFLTIAQVAGALTLLVGTGLLAESLFRLLSVEPGFETKSVLSLELSFPTDRYPEASNRSELLDRAIERVSAVAGVDAVAAAAWTPMSGSWSKAQTSTEDLGGDPSDRGRWPIVIAVSPGFFRALGVPMVQGHDFERRDASGGVAIVNRLLADRAWPGTTALGRRIKFGGPGSEYPWMEVIGVVEDSRLVGLANDEEETMFLPLLPMQNNRESVRLLVRTEDQNASRLVPSLRAAVRELEPDAPLDRAVTLEELTASQLREPRLHFVLLALFAALSLGLAALGVYAVVAQWTNARRRELGIRIALGADRKAILRLVLVQGGILVASGALGGVLASVFLARFLEASLFRVSPSDPVIYLTALLVLVAVGLTAILVPARRASRTDPATTLRAE